MPNKLRANIDLAKIQGSYWVKSPKTGERCLLIVPSASRLKHYSTKKEGGKDSLYGSLEIVPFKNPPIDREDTHFVVEPSTKEEREQPNPPQLPIIGSAREYQPYGEASSQPVARRTVPPPAADDSSADFTADDDEIPF